MKKKIKSAFLTLAPVAISVAVLLWVITLLEDSFGRFLQHIISPQYYYPGMGFLLGLLILSILAFLLNTYLFRKIVHFVEHIVARIPLVKSLYYAIKDIMRFLQLSSEEHAKKVVIVDLKHEEKIGFVTKEDFTDFPALQGEDKVVVFFPMSYQIGGFMTIVPKAQVRPLDLTVEEAFQFIITAGAKKQNRPIDEKQK